METPRPPRARRCPGPVWARRLPSAGEEPKSRAGTRLPWLSTLAVTVFVMVGTNFAARDQLDRVPLDAFARALLFTGAALLLFRHRYPRTVAIGTATSAAVYFAAGYAYGPIFLTVAVGTFAAIVAGYRTVAWCAIGGLWASHILVAHWLYLWLPPHRSAPWGQELFITAVVVAVVAVSELARVRREQFAKVRAERAAAERRRADEERLRIARELHDVLAHSISVINVQAGVGLALLDSDPEQARNALTTIKAASKEALGEVRQVLDTLRTRGDAPRSPAPGLDRLPELTEQAKGAGLAVDVTTEGAPVPLPPGADLAAFRIVQEALTNIVRHSGSRTARVLLGYAPGALEIRIDDDGPATAGPGELTGGGNGLVGMRERAAALGGTVEAGPREDGGFRVLARLPRVGAGGHAGEQGRVGREGRAGADDRAGADHRAGEDGCAGAPQDRAVPEDHAVPEDRGVAEDHAGPENRGAGAQDHPGPEDHDPSAGAGTVTPTATEEES